MKEALRQMPPVNDVLKARELSEFQGLLGQPFVSAVLDSILQQTRRELAKPGPAVARAELTSRIAAQLADRIRASLAPSLKRVINASGVVLHTNLGRSPLPAGAIEHLREVSIGYSNLEFDLEQGRRGKRNVHMEGTLKQLLGCEAATVVNNNAAAVLLVLNTLAESGEVVVSRGEQVEIGGSFRIPEVMAKSGVRLREVGTTNRTQIKDYEQAINENTRLLLRVHPSNFRMIGFTERPSLEEFASLGRRQDVPTFEDLGSGCMLDLEPLGVPDEPVAAASIRAGVDVVCFSGDKLLGGPQAGIIGGKKLYVDKIVQNPLFRALRVDKLTLSTLEFVLLAYLHGRIDEIPVWHMLRVPEDELRRRAIAFAKRAGSAAVPVQSRSVVGGGSVPEAHLPSWGIAIEAAEMSDAELERRLRFSEPPVIVRIENGRVILDFRTIRETEEEELLGVLTKVLNP